MGTTRIMITSLVLYGLYVAYGSNMDIATNVYAKVASTYANEWPDSERAFQSIRAGGIATDLGWEAFEPVCLTVSNHCAEIIADWHTYETNEMVRFTTLSALCFSGFANYTNTINHILAGYEADTNFCSWATIRFLNLPYGTSSQLDLQWSYDWPGVSNLVLRLRAAAEAHGDTNTVNMCNATIDGSLKQDCLDSIAQGEWTPPQRPSE